MPLLVDLRADYNTHLLVTEGEVPLLLVKFLKDLMMQTTILSSVFMVILLHVVLEQWRIKVMVQFCTRLACLKVVVLIPKPC